MAVKRSYRGGRGGGGGVKRGVGGGWGGGGGGVGGCMVMKLEISTSGTNCLLMDQVYTDGTLTCTQVYEAALKKNPRDGILASKIGQALVKTHSYTKVRKAWLGSLACAHMRGRDAYGIVFSTNM